MNKDNDEVQHHCGEPRGQSAFRDDLWLQRRKLGKAARSGYTAALKDHGVRGTGYGVCSNQLYRGYNDRDANEWRAAIGLPPGQPLRDYLQTADLVWIAAAETLAERNIRRRGQRGVAACASTSFLAGRQIKELLASPEPTSPMAANQNDAGAEAAA